MISVKITDISKFMSLLFSSEGFDQFFLTEAGIDTFAGFHIDGHTNLDFLDDTENYEPYTRWAKLRPICRELIKGKRTPLSMKFTFLLSDELTAKMLKNSGYPGIVSGIHFIFNVSFQGAELRLINATSTDSFLFDRTHDEIWDAQFRGMLGRMNVNYEEE